VTSYFRYHVPQNVFLVNNTTVTVVEPKRHCHYE